MPDSVKAPCPRCGSGIDPMLFPWTCPVCGQTDEKFNILKACDRCAFGPRLMDCPSCRHSFEAMRLVGEFSGKKLNVVPYSMVQDRGRFVYKLNYLDGAGGGHTVGERELLSLGRDALQSMFEAEFECCFPLAAYALVGCSKGTNDAAWLQVWVFKSKRTGRESDPTAQIAFSRSGTNHELVHVTIPDVLVDERWLAY